MNDATTKTFSAGFDEGYAHALDRIRHGDGILARMAAPEYFWAYEFKFDLREATRGEQEAVRVLFLAQRLELAGFTERHVELVELVLGHPSQARRYVDSGDFEYYEACA